MLEFIKFVLSSSRQLGLWRSSLILAISGLCIFSAVNSAYSNYQEARSKITGYLPQAFLAEFEKTTDFKRGVAAKGSDGSYQLRVEVGDIDYFFTNVPATEQATMANFEKKVLEKGGRIEYGEPVREKPVTPGEIGFDLAFFALLLVAPQVLLWRHVVPYVARSRGINLSLRSTSREAPSTDAPDGLSSARNRTRLSDVRGIDEIKTEVQKYIGYLQTPERYNRLGARPPRGLLLYGPPGTGKTMLARAIAREAGVKFFSSSGSEFEGMYMAQGKMRVNALFKRAREAKRAVIFIDEIDAVASRRMGVNSAAAHDVNNTVNALLTQIDGMDQEEGTMILVIGATNLLENLDPAFLRPGRFDSQLLVPPPDVQGRLDIMRLYAAKIKADENLDLEALARRTPGFTGAYIETLFNEAALIAAEEDADAVTAGHIEAARLKTLLGPAKKLFMTAEEKRRIAVHELGHAVVGLALSPWNTVEAVSIVPRGMALGVTLSRPERDLALKTQAQLEGEIAMAMGGRAAEQVILGEVSNGAAGDIRHATAVAESMVQSFGMGRDTGLVAMGRTGESKKDESDIIGEAYRRAIEVVEANKDLIMEWAEKLLEQSEIGPAGISEIKAKIALPENVKSA